jgi:hypothetical protein
MKEKLEFPDVWSVVNRIQNWGDDSFDWDKAYVASMFAKIAYLHIPHYELADRRANLIPCADYREKIVRGFRMNVGAVLEPFDIQSFVVETRAAIGVVMRVRGVIFVSLRGSQNAYDWHINLRASKAPFATYGDQGVEFHKGFYLAATECAKGIIEGIRGRSWTDSLIYVTGHSLGGAMAAIIHGLWAAKGGAFAGLISPSWRKDFLTHSCYTFGMPRYGNAAAVSVLPNPYRIYNLKDGVPLLPPKVMGYADCRNEYCLTETADAWIPSSAKPRGWSGRLLDSVKEVATHIDLNFRVMALKKRLVAAYKEHDMEVYMRRIAARSTFGGNNPPTH